MKLRNKKTGEVGYLRSTNWDEISLIIMDKNGVQLAKYNSLAELNADWEDCKGPKDYWYICSTSSYEVIRVFIDDGTDFERVQKDKEIGNCFKTREEAEKAMEKLKAWKRLKDKGFRFNGGDDACISYILDPVKWDDKLKKDFGLLFGGEDE